MNCVASILSRSRPVYRAVHVNKPHSQLFVRGVSTTSKAKKNPVGHSELKLSTWRDYGNSAMPIERDSNPTYTPTITSSGPEVGGEEHQYHDMILNCAAANDAKNAKFYFDKIRLEGVPPKLPVYSELIRVLMGSELFEDALAAFRELKQHQLNPDWNILNMMLDIGSKTHDVALIQQCVRDLWNMGMSAEHKPEFAYYFASLSNL